MNRSYAKMHSMKIDANVEIDMSDGVRLSARVYRPQEEGRFPVLLAVSPYQHEADSIPHSTLFLWREVGPVDWYVEAHGYAVVHVDVRGTGLSEGEYNFLDKREQQDLYEIIEWCARQPWSNERVGGYGQSYYCWSQWFMGIVDPPGLACIAPYDGAVDIYRDAAYHGGIYCDFLPWWYQMVRVNNLHRPPGKNPGKLLSVDIAREFIEHPTYDDWWRERSPWERLGEIRVPTLSIGHWGKMGLHLRGNLIGYEQVSAPKKLIVTGARDVFEAHDLFEDIDFHERELLPFYDRHLKEKANGVMDSAPVKIFVRGRDAFREEAEWPLSRATYASLYLQPQSSGSVTSLNDGSLSWSAPERQEGATTFDYPDPQWKLGVAAMGAHGPDPLRRILTFCTPALEEDLEVTGPAILELYLSSTNTDTDVFVKVADQFPQTDADRGGNLQSASVVITKGWLRASHREKDERLSTIHRPFYTHATPTPIEPGQVIKLEIELLPFSNVFRKGHRIRLDIANGDSPVTDTIFTHQYSWFKVGRDTFYHNAKYPSRLILPVIR